MSQYLIIFLIVAVFRGVVWIVQKVQQNAKAREALMAQQAGGATQSGPPLPDPATRSMTVDAPAPVREVVRPGGAAIPAPGRTPRPPKSGRGMKVDRGAVSRSRGGASQRAVGQATAAISATAPSPNAGAWTVAQTPRRGGQDSTRTSAVRQTPPRVAPLSRADICEARVDQSSTDVRKLLLDRSSLRQALLAREILGPPRGFTV